MDLANLPRRRGAAPRVQIFVSDLSATGVVRNAVAIANHAAASGFDVRLLTCTANGILRDDIDQRVTIIELLEMAKRGANRQSQLRQIFKSYRRHSRTWRPDILFSAGNHGHLLSTFAWLGLPGTKILRISNDLNHGMPGPATRLWRRAKFRLMAMLADRLVLISRAHAADPLLSRMLAKGKAIIAPNGVDVERVRAASLQPCPHPWAVDRGVPIVLAVGRHSKQKNCGLLLKAFAAARRLRPLRLIIIGEGPTGETVRLHNFAVELGIASDVSFVPPTSNPFPYFAAADALALPSLWEGSSNVLLEALACGTPVIASQTAGDAEHVLGGGEFGVLIDPADEQALACAMLRQTGCDPIGPANRAIAFDRAIVLEDYIRLFRQCDHATGRRPRPEIAGLRLVPRNQHPRFVPSEGR